MTEKLIKRANELLRKKEYYNDFIKIIDGKGTTNSIDFVIGLMTPEEREKVKSFIKTILLRSIDEMEKELKEI